jgi:hypothetical protein
VPEKGDEVTADGARLIVDDVEGNRINKVRIIKLPHDGGGLPAAGPEGNASSAAPPPSQDGLEGNRRGNTA